MSGKKVYYTVDRNGTLKESMELSLKKYNDINPQFLQEHVDELFSEGVSSHGENYLLKNDKKTLLVSPNLELVFEYVRRSNFIELPSRFQSIFAWGNIEDTEWFIEKFPGENSRIYEVSSDIVHKADMNLLNASNSILVTSYFAKKYWKGEEESEEPKWEFLLKCPVKVLNQVK